MNIAIDTNAYTDLLRGHSHVVQTVTLASKIYLPVIVLGELQAGFACGTREGQNLKILSTFLASPKVRVLNVDVDTPTYYAVLFRQLRDQGTPIPTNDLWIASLSIQHGLQLCTTDRHFEHLPQITRC